MNNIQRPPNSIDFRRQHENLIYFGAESTTITVGSYDTEYQLCQVGFTRDGSIRVSFPYFPAGVLGLVAVSQFPSGYKSGPVTLSLTDHGKVTSELVKYHHHSDGRAHFSQDGKVRTEVIRQSFRLDGPIGNLFWFHAYRPSDFKPFREHQARAGRLYLRSRFTHGVPAAVTVHAEWLRKSDLVRSIQPPGLPAGPKTVVNRISTGTESETFFLGEPRGFPLRDHVLTIKAYETQAIGNETGMILLGGFDSHEVSSADTIIEHEGCLAFLYPMENLDLAEKLGSIDLPMPSQPQR